MRFGIEPQLARGAAALPLGRSGATSRSTTVSRDRLRRRRSAVLQSRGSKDLTATSGADPATRALRARREIVIDGDGPGQAFGRCSSASTRRLAIERLARELPASYVAFDLLELDGVSCSRSRSSPRARSTRSRRAPLGAGQRPGRGERWLEQTEASSPSASTPPTPRRRTSMVRSSASARSTASSLASGGRRARERRLADSRLYEPDGRLRPVGHTSAFTAKRKLELRQELAAYETGERGSGEPAAGAQTATSNGLSCAPSWWSSELRPCQRWTDPSRHEGPAWREDKRPRVHDRPAALTWARSRRSTLGR